MCDAPHSDQTPCNIVAFGPGTIMVVAGVALIARAVVLWFGENVIGPTRA